MGPPVPRRARGARTAGKRGARDIARERALASRGGKQFADAVFKILFLWISKLKCTLQSIAQLKIKDPSSTIAKAGRGFTQGIEQEQHANWAKISAPMNSEPAP
jgi:hypothetical protein